MSPKRRPRTKTPQTTPNTCPLNLDFEALACTRAHFTVLPLGPKMSPKWYLKAFEMEARRAMWDQKSSMRDVYEDMLKHIIKKSSCWLQKHAQMGAGKMIFLVFFRVWAPRCPRGCQGPSKGCSEGEYCPKQALRAPGKGGNT